MGHQLALLPQQLAQRTVAQGSSASQLLSAQRHGSVGVLNLLCHGWGRGATR